MPARTVVMDRLDKWDGAEHAELTPGEYTQLTGRAGRRGIDIEGHAVVVLGPRVSAAKVLPLASKRTYPLRSAFRPTYNMAVNLTGRLGPARARQVLDLSFAQFQADRSVAGLVAQIRRLGAGLDGYAKAMRCERGDFASYQALRDQLGAAEKLARPSRRDIADLRAQLRAHPAHRCPDREKHARWARRLAKAEAQRAALEQTMRHRTGSLARQFDQVCAVLEDLGYLRRGGVTAAGRILARIYAERDLVIAECVRAGLWDALAPGALAQAVTALVYEPRGEARDEPERPGGAARAVIAAQVQAWERVAAREEARGLPPSQGVEPQACALVGRWAAGQSLARTLAGDLLSPGDFVRLVGRVVDVLDHVRAVAPNAQLHQAAQAAIGQLRRGVASPEGMVSPAV
jgi:ATP-dependent RNA helicase HelY